MILTTSHLRLVEPAKYEGDPPTETRRLHYGSPLYIDLILHGTAVLSLSLATLIFGFKRVAGLPLEIKVHRQELKNQLAEARLEAARLELEEKELVRERSDLPVPPVTSPSDREKIRLSVYDQALDRGVFPWVVEEATLTDQEMARAGD